MRSSRVVQPPVSGVPVPGATSHFVSSASLNPEYGSKGGLGLTGRIQGVDVNREIHRVRGANTVPDFLDDAVGSW